MLSENAIVKVKGTGTGETTLTSTATAEGELNQKILSQTVADIVVIKLADVLYTRIRIQHRQGLWMSQNDRYKFFWNSYRSTS